MTAGYSIRPGTDDDFDGFFEVFSAVASEAKWLGAQPPLDRDHSHERWTGWVGNEASAILLAVAGEGGEVIGWITAEHAPSGHVGIGMGVGEQWRGQGVGRALLEAAIAWARERGAHKMTLQAWPHNHAAIGLYERAGFMIEGRFARHWRRKNGELWDVVVMGLVLDTESPGCPY